MWKRRARWPPPWSRPPVPAPRDLDSRSATAVTVEPAIDPRAIQLKSDRTSFIVAPPYPAQRRQLVTFDRRSFTCGAKNHVDIIAAGAIDRIPQGPDFVDRHPVLRVQQDDRIDFARRQTFQELPKTGVVRNDQSRTIAHTLILATLQIWRQTTIARTGIAAMERLPGEIIGIVRMTVDQTQQTRVKHVVQRGTAAQQRSLSWRDTEAEQQSRRCRDQPDQRRMKHAIEALQRCDARGRIRLAVQKYRRVDPATFRREMRKTDETAEHAVTVKTIGEIGVARAADDISLVPIGARLRIQPWPQPRAIKVRIGRLVGRAEELPEIRIIGKGTQAR